MRIDIPIEDLPFGAVVLFDPAAMSELLSADPCPSRAVSRFPRRLEAEAGRSNALVVRIGEYGMPALFVDEAQVASRLNHSNIVQIYQIHPFFVKLLPELLHNKFLLLF